MQQTLGVDASPQEAAILNTSVLKLDYLVLTFAVAQSHHSSMICSLQSISPITDALF